MSAATDEDLPMCFGGQVQRVRGRTLPAECWEATTRIGRLVLATWPNLGYWTVHWHPPRASPVTLCSGVDGALRDAIAAAETQLRALQQILSCDDEGAA